MSKQDDQAKSSIRANVKSRREQFEEQLRSLQEDIASLSLKMAEPSRNGMRWLCESIYLLTAIP